MKNNTLKLARKLSRLSLFFLQNMTSVFFAGLEVDSLIF